MKFYLECINCKEKYDANKVIYNCNCGGLLEVKYEDIKISKDFKKRKINVWKYKEFLPIIKENKIISLNEGGTPLYFCKRISKEINLSIFVKNEGANPTGSFKDRGMTVGVTKALELRMNEVACASTGNTSASLAAYAARAGIKAYVFIPYGKIALGKLAQALVYGAEIIAIKGSFDDALKKVLSLSSKMYILNSINPFRLEGQKTIAYEIFDQLGYVPDKVIVPVGNAGNISAIWKGFKEYYEYGFIKELPKMIGVQAKGANPIVRMFKNKKESLKPIKNPKTIATAIRIGSPVNWPKAIKAIKESNGIILDVSDKEIINAQYLLASKEGIFVEPASAASIAALLKLSKESFFDKKEKIVCIATGSGLKDPDIIIENYKNRIKIVHH
ncbi:MAG: threonine synthase [Nitrososphaerota archaeon]